MSGLINWKKANIPSSNPDVDHVYVGVDLVDQKLYSKDSTGLVTKYPTGDQVTDEIEAGVNDAKDYTDARADAIIGSPPPVPLRSTLGLLSDAIDTKYDASNPNGYETPLELNARDSANRNRANHTGTQLASTISDFASTVRSTVLTGLSTATSQVVAATDTILQAIGYLQAQVNNLKNPATTNVNNNTVITTTSTTDVLVTNMTLTPPAGTYLVIFSCTYEGGNNTSKMFISIYGGGAAIGNSFRSTVSRNNVGYQEVISVSTQAEVTVNGTQAIEARWRGSGGTFTMYDKSLNIMRIR